MDKFYYPQKSIFTFQLNKLFNLSLHRLEKDKNCYEDVDVYWDASIENDSIEKMNEMKVFGGFHWIFELEKTKTKV